MRATVQQPPLSREMWNHSFSHFSVDAVRKGLEERNTCFAVTDLLESSREKSRISATCITGLQKEGLGFDCNAVNSGIDVFQEGAKQLMYPIVDVLDFRSAASLRGNFELGSDANDFLASEYGQTLGADPFRDPREVMIDMIREQQNPDFAFDRRDLANRFFLQNASNQIASANVQTQSEGFRQSHQENLEMKQEALDATQVRRDRAGRSVNVVPLTKSQKRQREQYDRETERLSEASVSSRFGSMGTRNDMSMRGGSTPGSFGNLMARGGFGTPASTSASLDAIDVLFGNEMSPNPAEYRRLDVLQEATNAAFVRGQNSVLDNITTTPPVRQRGPTKKNLREKMLSPIRQGFDRAMSIRTRSQSAEESKSRRK